MIRGTISAGALTEPLMDVGRRRAEQGIPLHDVLLAYLVGTQSFWEQIWQLTPNEPALRNEVQSLVTKSSLDLLQHAVTAVSEGYLQVQEARVADEEHDLQALVETLAGIRNPDRRHEERAVLRGIDLTAIRWCAVVMTDEETTGSQVRDLRRMEPAAAVGRIGRTVIAYLPGEKPSLPQFGFVGLAAADDTAAGYRRARSAMQVGVHLGQQMVCYEDVMPLALVLGGPTGEREAFISAQLGPVLEDPLGEELLKSLEAFYKAGQSVAAAARALFVHRHTLEYRLARLEALLGRDLREPAGRLLLEFALALRNPSAG
jgi:hypothetical protein